MGEPLQPNVWDKLLDAAFGIGRALFIALVVVLAIWAVFFTGRSLPG